VRSVEHLLERGGTPAGRREIAEASGVSPKLVLEWVNHADLMRVKGVGSEYANLLEAAGVDSVPELAQRNPATLAAKLAEINEAKRLVRQLPREAQVQQWVSEAKALPRAVHH
jgi:predicted flap endonuclease-1-like 5' DNA nuclease